MNPQVNIAISKIKELEFSISSGASKSESVNFTVTSEFNIEMNTFSIYIVYDLIDVATEQIVLHIKVVNTFHIENLLQFKVSDELALSLPDNVLITMLSLSISHSRALLAKNTSGTIYENSLIPIVNPTEIAKQVFNLK